MKNDEAIWDEYYVSNIKEEFNEEISNKIGDLAKQDKFHEVIEILNSIEDLEERTYLCFELLSLMEHQEL